MDLELFQLSDYREFLSIVYTRKKREKTYFSYDFIAAKIGSKSRSYISRIMKGSRSITIPNCFKLSQALELSTAESDFFFNLVCYNQASNDLEKNYFGDKLNHIRVNLDLPGLSQAS